MANILKECSRCFYWSGNLQLIRLRRHLEDE
jgi:hypothetical protein